MLISSKGRYAIRLMIDLAENDSGDFIPLKTIAERQQLSEKYLEAIIAVLTKAGYLTGHRGKSGGYKLTREPKSYSVGSILRLTEDGISPVACLQNKPNRCVRAGECRTLPMWERLDEIIGAYLESISIADLLQCPGTADCALDFSVDGNTK